MCFCVVSHLPVLLPGKTSVLSWLWRNFQFAKGKKRIKGVRRFLFIGGLFMRCEGVTQETSIVLQYAFCIWLMCQKGWSDWVCHSVLSSALEVEAQKLDQLIITSVRYKDKRHPRPPWRPLLAIVVSHLPVLLPGKTSVLTFNCGILVAGVGGVETQGGNGRVRQKVLLLFSKWSKRTIEMQEVYILLLKKPGFRHLSRLSKKSNIRFRRK